MTGTKATDGSDQARGGGTRHAPDQLPRADCSVDRDGRLVVRFGFEHRTAERPQLLLRLRPPKGKPESVTRLVGLEPDGPAGAPAGGAEHSWRAVLEPEPALAEGRWDLFVLPEPDAERTPLLAGVRDLRALPAGREPGRTPLPLAVRVPFATGDGTLAVRTWLRAAHVEADRIEVGAEATTVRARLFGLRPGVGATALLRLRGAAGEVREAELHTEGGDGVRFTFSQRELVDTPDGAPGVWDVLVRPGTGARPIRVGRLLDDVADRKKVYVFPAVTLNGLTARTYYTLDNELSVEVTAG
ncbi:hypothetical protein [Streptomyces sp. NPDC008125]|uniref:hypothetical protein n=1 Tax=Streptomyces sp. NPDC008125 TaxID=3364811 RepID=UPI0036E10FAB